MLINYDPDMWETVLESHTCDYHKKHPGVNWPGCVCSGSISQHRVSDEVYAERVKKRQGERDAVILREAESIKADHERHVNAEIFRSIEDHATVWEALANYNHETQEQP